MRLGLWIRKKTRLRVRAVRQKYYRKDRWYTWAAGDQFLYHPGQMAIKYQRYAHRPNPYLDRTQPVELPYHLSPYPGTRDWDGTNSRYGEEWTERREEVRLRDGKRCVLCGSTERVEVHHIRKHKGNQEHHPARLIALCASCHRKARNPRSETSLRLAKHYLTTGEPDEAKVSRPVREGAQENIPMET